jgi:hypothetical protein
VYTYSCTIASKAAVPDYELASELPIAAVPDYELAVPDYELQYLIMSSLKQQYLIMSSNASEAEDC